MKSRTFVAAICLLAASTLGATITTTFTAHADLTAGTQPRSVAIGDLNNDGRADLAVANTTATVSVFLNTTAPGATTPSFTTKFDFATGSASFAVAIADINGDGQRDIVVANFSSASVSVLRNTTVLGGGVPTFAAKQDFAVTAATSPGGIAIADVNGDGLPDIALGVGSANVVAVLLNTTAPGAITFSFAAHQDFVTNSAPAVAMADLNGDGRPDIADTGSGSDYVSILRNTTAPGATIASFAARQDFVTGNGPRSVAIGDLNGDGKPDLAISCASASLPDTLSVLLNMTAPGATTFAFSGHQELAALSNPQFNVIQDLNGDGKPDVAMVGQGSANVSVFLNTTAPGATAATFAARLDFATAGAPWGVAAADLNGDGKPDLVTANQSTDNASVLINTTAAGAPVFFTTQRTFATSSVPTAIAGGDFNTDGKQDLAVVEYLFGKVSVLMNTTAPGAAIPAFAARQDFTITSGSRGVRTADLNGDGKPDLITLDYYASNVSVLRNTTAPGASVAAFAAKQDLVTSGLAGSGFDTSDVVVGDLNGDGKPDIVVTNETANEVSVLINQTAPGATTFAFAARVSFVTLATPGALTIGDINNDGKPDLAVLNYSLQSVSIFLNATLPGGAASFGAGQSFGTFGVAAAVTVRDINGDGKPDVSVSTAARVAVLLNVTAPGAATSSFAAVQTFDTGAGPSGDLAIADVNGDGMPDMVTANSTDGTLSILLNTTAAGGSTQTFAVKADLTAGSSPASVVIADYNGDGRPDLATVNTGNDTVAVFMSTIPASVEINSGDQQSVQVNAPYLPLITIIRDAGGAAVQGVMVAYVVVPGPASAGGTFAGPATVPTNGAGFSTAPTLTANNSTGAFTVTASAPGVALPATFTFNNHIPDQVTYLAAAAISATSVSVTWTANPYATAYDVIRITQYPTSQQTTVSSQLPGTSFTDTTASPNTAYLYAVRVSQPMAGYLAQDLATTVMFTDPTLTPGSTVIRAVHFTELRTAVNAVQMLAGQTPTLFTDALTAGSTRIRALHFNELAQALQSARGSIGMSFSYPDAVAGVTTIKVADVEKIRDGVK